MRISESCSDGLLLPALVVVVVGCRVTSIYFADAERLFRQQLHKQPTCRCGCRSPPAMSGLVYRTTGASPGRVHVALSLSLAPTTPSFSLHRHHFTDVATLGRVQKLETRSSEREEHSQHTASTCKQVKAARNCM